MKKWILLLVAALLLTGCVPQAAAPSESSEASTQTQTAPGTEATQPSVSVEDGAPLNAMTLGKVYDAVIGFQGKLLLFSGVELSVWTFGADEPEATARIAALPLPGSGRLQVVGENIIYYDKLTGSLVYLDGNLNEVKRLSAGEEILGDPYLTSDGTAMYFCSGNGLRVWDLETGICRNLKIQAGNWLGISGALLEETALRCQLQEADGTVRTLLIAMENGQTLYEGDRLNGVVESGKYYCYVTDREWIFGTEGQRSQLLKLSHAIPMPGIQAALTATAGETGMALDLFDLSTGRRVASLTAAGMTQVSGVTAFDGYLWLFGDGQLWRWDPTLTPIADETVYSTDLYTAENPDLEGLTALQSSATALAQQYGVEILMWDQVASAEPAGYTFEVEYRTEVYAAALKTLAVAFAKLPASMLSRAAEWAQDGTLRIVLTGGISTPSQTAYSTVTGMEYILDGKVYIVLEMGSFLERAFYHALFHVIDPLVLSNSIAYYQWNDLNPSGFQYDNDYLANLDRDPSQYLGENRYFIDTYSMSFAVEDRARIFEYAMMSGCENYFASTTMQAKLEMLCDGLREVFGLDGDGYLWEQYLK